jgi:hypothetical protein
MFTSPPTPHSWIRTDTFAIQTIADSQMMLENREESDDGMFKTITIPAATDGVIEQWLQNLTTDRTAQLEETSTTMLMYKSILRLM